MSREDLLEANQTLRNALHQIGQLLEGTDLGAQSKMNMDELAGENDKLLELLDVVKHLADAAVDDLDEGEDDPD